MINSEPFLRFKWCLNYVFSFGYYGIAVLLQLDKKLQWKALYESVILSLGIIVILFCAKAFSVLLVE
jgi:hypothetical protein